jgi:hypothetical protein
MWDFWSKWHWGRFSQRSSVSPANHSTDCSTLTIIRGWYNRPNSGRRAKWTHLTTPKGRISISITQLKPAEVQEVVSSLNPRKSSGYDLITGNILKELPVMGIKYLTQLFNAALLKWYFPGTMESRTNHPHLESRETS